MQTIDKFQISCRAKEGLEQCCLRMESEYDKLVQLKTKGELKGFAGYLVLSGFAHNQSVNVSNYVKSLMHRCFLLML